MNLSRMLRELTRAHQAINDTDEPVMVGLQVVTGGVKARFYADSLDPGWESTGRSVNEAVVSLALLTLGHARALRELTATGRWLSETVARLERVLDEEA